MSRRLWPPGSLSSCHQSDQHYDQGVTTSIDKGCLPIRQTMCLFTAIMEFLERWLDGAEFKDRGAGRLT